MMTAGTRIALWSRENGVLLGRVLAVRIQASGHPIYDLVLDTRGAVEAHDTIVWPIEGLAGHSGPVPLCQLSSQIGTA
jgi:hypothetical protein